LSEPKAVKILGDVGAGHVLGRYELLLPIASGGMATVWAARMKGSRGFQKIVAVKTMLPSMSDDPQFEQMFLDEAALASRIRHPNVAEILDLGEESGVLFLVMEWVDGESLSVLMKSGAKRGGVPLPVALRIVMAVCAGVHAAHELRDEAGHLLGVVHRDVSPQNILVTFDGVVKIVDFGVAKAAGRAASQTSAGQVKGKAAYMSPEQAQGAPIDRRTDVFAVGILLYQLTTGKHPFRGENEVATLYNICSEDAVTPPSKHVPDYPAALAPVVERALAKRADARYATASEFGRALDTVAREIGAGSEEEVAVFVRELLGERQDKRNETLRAALRLADDRSARREADPEAVSHTGFTPVSSVTLPGMGSPSDPEATAPGSVRHGAMTDATAADSHSPAARFRSTRRRSPWLTVGLLVSAVLVGMAAAYRFARTADRGSLSSAVPDAHVLVGPTAIAPYEVPPSGGSTAAPSMAETEATGVQVKDEKAGSKPVDSLAAAAAVPLSTGKGRGAGRGATAATPSAHRTTPRPPAPFVAPVRNPGF
jgi:serine/threonine-protein kinase